MDSSLLTSSLLGTSLFKASLAERHSATFALARRGYASTSNGAPPPPPPTGASKGVVPPPGTSANGAHLAGAAASTAYNSSSRAAQAAATLRGWSAVRASPFKHLFTFGALHVTIAQLSLIPAYAFLHYSGIGNSLLAGPQAAYVLSRPLPAFAASSLGITDKLNYDGAKNKGPTVEDALEVGLRKVASGAWASGGFVIRLLSGIKKDDPIESMKHIANTTQMLKEGKLDAAQGAEEAGNAMDEMKGKRSIGGRAKDLMGNRAKGIAGDVKLSQVRDALGAWVIVKMLLPLRLPLSMWLTPRFARGLVRMYPRGA